MLNKKVVYILDDDQMINEVIFDGYINKLKQSYKVYAPVVRKGKGAFSDTDAIRYSEVNSINEIEFDKKSNFSPKEIINPTRKSYGRSTKIMSNIYMPIR